MTVPASHGDAAHPHAGRRVPPTLLALDEHLFLPDASQWLLIDAENQAVPRTSVPSLSDGLELVGRGRIAALVGHLRDGVGVVDVDAVDPAGKVPAEFGHFLASDIADWLRRRGCWVLERPSGGAEGRWHIFFAHPDFHYAPAGTRSGFAATVGDYLTALATDTGVRPGKLDLRDAVRPLCSPHRKGAAPRPKGDLRAALRSLKRLLPGRPPSAPLRPRRKTKTSTDPSPAAPAPGPAGQASSTAAGAAAQGFVVPLSLQRWSRPLRPDWRRYLLTGALPAGPWSAGATRTRAAVEVDRSLVEASCTREMVWAIGNPQTAWRVIRESHPSAMTKAKHQGYSWWLTYVWNETVRAAHQFHAAGEKPDRPQAPAAGPPAVVVEAVATAREELTRLMWTVPTRQRPALLLVGHHLLDRMLRERSLRVPCPERDLVLDTGLADRKTIRAALARLNGRLGTLHTDCLSPLDRESSSYEFEIETASDAGGRQIPPPVFHPPPPARGLWATLPRSSHALWRMLTHAAGPNSAADLATQAGLVDSPCEPASKSQRATATTALAALSNAGLARVDEHGHWQAATAAPAPTIERDAREAYARQSEAVEAERAVYRAGSSTSWIAGRARAMKAQRAKEKAWWQGLPAATRLGRANARRLEFDQMSITQQSALKARLAERRARAGVDELSTYRDWVRTVPADEYLARSLERKQSFQDLSPAERGARVDAWDRHRARYGLTSQRLADSGATRADGTDPTPDSEHAGLLPDGPAVRDAVFLERQGELFGPSASQQAAG